MPKVRAKLNTVGIRGYSLELDFGDITQVVETDMVFSNGDLNTNIIEFDLKQDGQVIQLDAAATVHATVLRTDGNVVIYPGEIMDASGGKVKIILHHSARTPGIEYMELVVSNTKTTKLISPRISYTVIDSLDNLAQSLPNIQTGLLDMLIRECKELKKDIHGRYEDAINVGNVETIGARTNDVTGKTYNSLKERLDSEFAAQPEFNDVLMKKDVISATQLNRTLDSEKIKIANLSEEVKRAMSHTISKSQYFNSTNIEEILNEIGQKLSSI